MKKITKEQKVAKHLATMANDLDLDLERVGIEIARLRPMVTYNRLMVIAEAAAFEQENIIGRESNTPLF